MKSPIFLFSMPRAGSTLLQRILLSHKSIGGTAEPWLLLPMVYNIKNQGTISEYSSKLSHKAVMHVLENIPNHEAFYFSQVKIFSDGIYSKLLKNTEYYFLDKTPRYYLIIDEIYKIYPDAKFIFLFRNPIHVYASILTTWCNNNFFGLYGSHNDLKYGFNKLSEAYTRHKHKTNTYALKYEDLVTNSKKHIKKIQEFLEIEYDKELGSNFVNSSIDTKNNKMLGDPTGIEKYKTISNNSLNKWKFVFNTSYRKFLLTKYIVKTVKKENLIAQGYNQEDLIKDIKELNNKGKHFFLRDFINFSSYKIIVKFNLFILFSKELKWTRKKFIS